MQVEVRRAAANEGERLREIALAAKASWGYDLQRVREWAALGDFTPAGLRQKDVYVAEADRNVVGWTGAIHRGDVWWLDDLWIEPKWMRKGIGRRLFEAAAEQGRQRGAIRMEWEAERHAIGFYEKMGGRYVRESEPGVWGRTSAIMALDLR
jgi:GNAT superfamily N-acetyltransferase